MNPAPYHVWLVCSPHVATLSRMTIVTNGDERKIDQIEKHLNKLVDVAALQDITAGSHLEREVVLAKLVANTEQKADLDKIVVAFNARLITVSDSQFIVEMSGSSEKVDELLKSMNGITILELARSGVTGLSSDETALTVA
jgi:acetolactate synthase-1/3 small subunit